MDHMHLEYGTMSLTLRRDDSSVDHWSWFLTNRGGVNLTMQMNLAEMKALITLVNMSKEAAR